MDTLLILKDFLEIFNRIINKYNTLNQRAYDFGTGDLLHPSEIHMLSTIGKGDEQNITDVSQKLAISKSAVSQIIYRLCSKGFVEKYKKPDNEKNILMKLTEKGKTAVNGYHIFKKDIFRELIAEIEMLDAEQIKFLYNAFEKIDKHMDYKLEKYI